MVEQVGGTHYGGPQASWQHWDWMAVLYGPAWFVGSATKYVCRWRRKKSLEDLAKALSYVDKLLALHSASKIHYDARNRVCLFLDRLAARYELTGQEKAFCDLIYHYRDASELQEARAILVAIYNAAQNEM